MPGIVGLITKLPRARAELQLGMMLEKLRHQASYVVGTYSDPESGVYVGWVARKGSFAQAMPLRNEREDVCLAFSGEEFPEPGTIAELKAKGHSLGSEQASYLVHLYEEQPTFPKMLNGRFHGLLTDRTRKRTLLFNDRYGLHRLYYHQSEEAFYFAAEAKAILAVVPQLRNIDVRGLGEFIACGCVLENRTLFEGVRVLPSGSAWSFSNAELLERATYFDPSEWESQETLDEETYYQQLREVFSTNLPRYFEGEQRIGLSLTAGLDTRMIMAWHKAPQGSLPCYSFAGAFRESQDVMIARQIAQACRQPYQTISVDGEFLSRFPHYAERTVALTDGCLGVNHSPDLFVNERAAEIAPVRMTGNYGGEVLRQVRAFKPVQPPIDLFSAELTAQISRAEKTYHGVLDTHPLSFAVFRQAPWHHYGLLALEETQVSLRSPYLDNDFVRTVFRAPRSAATTRISRRLIEEGDSGLALIRTDRSPISQNGWRSKAIRKFLDLTVKAEYAFDYGMPHWAARIEKGLAPLHLEKLFLGRHKFYHFRTWYRNILAAYIREILLDARTRSRPYLQASSLERVVRMHTQGTANHTLAIHTLLSLELTHRLLLD